MQRRFIRFTVLTFFFISCASAAFKVPDENFFTDGFVLEKGYTQYVETANNTKLDMPVVERFKQNCEEAKKNAMERFLKEKSLTKANTQLLGEYLEKGGSCRIRIALKAG
ncbi:MAG: hypothetical protein LDLANPLL_01716 [Turneriella sp.]|nr:hypothetical protein [Turneriella sp.]